MKTTKILNITGMHCESCTKLISMDLASIGVDARVDHYSGKAEISYDSSIIDDKKILSTIRQSGYQGSFLNS